MKCGILYDVTDFTLKSLRLLVKHPGIRASEFAALMWPNLKKPGRMGGTHLGRLQEMGLVDQRFDPPYWIAGQVVPKQRYYVTEEGYNVHEFHRKQRYCTPGNSSNND